MSNLSDKDIDRLSRDAAEFYEPDDGMLSWNKLEQQLVRHIPDRPPDTPSFFRMRPLIWAPAILLLTGITYYIIKRVTYNPHSTLKTQTEKQIGQSAKPVPENGEISKTNNDRNPAAGNTDVLSGKKSAKEIAAGRADGKSPEAAGQSASAADTGYSMPTSAANPGLLKSAEKHISSKKTGVKTSSPGHAGAAGNTMQGDGRERFGPGYLSDPANKESGSHSVTKTGAAQQGRSEDNGSSKQRTTGQKIPMVNLPALFVSWARPVVKGNDSSLTRFAAAATRQTPKPKSLQVNRSLTIGLVMGPDYSTADGKTNDQLGNNLGISIGYYLSKRLSINTGIQYSLKNYWAEGKAFQPQPQNRYAISAFAFPRIESVSGSCSMFEIPLTLRYDFFRQGKTRLFADAGLSSYLIRKQQYTYFFHNSGRSYEWKNENNDHLNYWFAVGSFSAGVEQDLGKGFSFQAEPFLRLPFHGMGAGNTNLRSYGILFSIRYTPALGRTRK
jgi:hypothetical protein